MTMTEELMLVEAKDRFDERGIQFQFRARNMEQAVESFENSCTKCSMYRECTGHACSIERAFIYNTRKFHKELTDPRIRQRVELALELG